MNRKEINSLLVSIVVFGVIAGILNAILSPEPTLVGNVAYAIFMGIILAIGFYILEKKNARKK